MRGHLVTLGFMLYASTAHAQALATGPAGGGFAGIEDPRVAEPGHGAVGYLFDNYDRDPEGIDVTDSRILWRVGIWRNTEAFGSLLFARGVVTPGDKVFPSPPAAVIAISGGRPEPPFRPMYQFIPYLGDISTDFRSFGLGDAEVGIRHRVRDQDGPVPETSLSLSISVPMRRDLDHLRSGFGTGTVDGRLTTAFAWDIGHTRLAANVGHRWNGHLRYDDLVIEPTGEISRGPIDRPGMFMYGVGARQQLSSWLSLSGQFMGWKPIGHRTPSLHET